MKKIYRLLISILLLFTFASCNMVQGNDPKEPSKNGVGGGENPVVGDSGIQFTVTLLLDDAPFTGGKDIVAQWSDGVSLYVADTNASGVASVTGLDGEYEVTLSNLPEGYTYNPNVYTASNDDPNIEIVIWEIYYPKTNGGADGSGLYSPIKIYRTGVFRTTITDAKQIVYYEFKPLENGQYFVESFVDIRANEVNPIANVHVGTSAWKPETPSYVLNDESEYCSTYTKNFLYEILVDKSEVSNVYTYGIRASQINGNYPVIVDFLILRADEYSREKNRGAMRYATALDHNKTAEEQKATRPDGTWVDADTALGEQRIFDGSRYIYSDPQTGGDGYYHLETADGPIVYAKIASPCRFLDVAFPDIEMMGSKALTLSNGKENFKLMIEGYAKIKSTGFYLTNEEKAICEKYPIGYSEVCNSDGAYPVNAEIKEFLQKYSTQQRFFADGNGRIENQGYYASEEDQWLFACGYYQ